MHHAHANLGAVVLAVRQHEHLRVEHLRQRSRSAAPSVAPSGAISRNQRRHQSQSAAMQRALSKSMVTSGNQRPCKGREANGAAIITCWSHPDACESEYATRRSSSIAFSVGRKNAQPTLSVKCCTLQPARGGGCAVMSTCMQGSSSVAINVPVHTARPRPNPYWRHGWIGFDLPSAAISGGSPDASIRIQM
jgi:hypothetical protein